MSKAFVNEDQETDDDDLAEAESAPRRGPAYITPEGFRKLQAELAHLWKVERPRVTEEVAAAAAQGDRSENAEYIYGKKKLREIDRRIRFLTRRLDTVTVVQAPPQDRDKVFFGAWVTIEDDEGRETTYRIVGSDEFDLSRRWISIDSPVARALIGKRTGEQAVVLRPKGPTEVTVVAIRYGDEAPA